MRHDHLTTELPFERLLIANRGEIACRVIQTARRLGIYTIAVYSQPDKHSRHVQMADEAVCLGGASATESYLNMDAVIQAAIQARANAIHPGYGFLSENARFSQACEQAGMTFIGPNADVIDTMGSKSAAKALMGKAGLPLIPGYYGDEQSEHYLYQQAESIGFPLMIKASAGGGGKGMRRVDDIGSFLAALQSAKNEARNSFGDDKVLLEACLIAPRHIEVQVFCDQHGNGVYLGDRDCSIQRRHQKVIEEAPAVNIREDIRQQMGELSVKAALSIGYVGAGTMEFLLDDKGGFYFMEMNTRLQVEHPVTERVTGLDLVEWQLRIAAGAALPLSQHEIKLKGHALEVRLYAEQPEQEFLPAAGKLALLRFPEHLPYCRVDTGVVEGDEVTVHYDPMIAKLIVWGANREQACQHLQLALAATHISGLPTNLTFLRKLIAIRPFINADLSTAFIAEFSEQIWAKQLFEPASIEVAAVIANQLWQQQTFTGEIIWQQPLGMRLNQSALMQQRVRMDGRLIHARLESDPQGFTVTLPNCTWHGIATLEIRQGGYQLFIEGLPVIRVVPCDSGIYLLTDNFECLVMPESLQPKVSIADEQQAMLAPMSGTIVATLAEVGDRVEKGQALVVMEAMKMEHTIKSPYAGVVKTLSMETGMQVQQGKVLVEVEPDT